MTTPTTCTGCDHLRTDLTVLRCFHPKAPFEPMVGGLHDAPVPPLWCPRREATSPLATPERDVDHPLATHDSVRLVHGPFVPSPRAVETTVAEMKRVRKERVETSASTLRGLPGDLRLAREQQARDGAAVDTLTRRLADACELLVEERAAVAATDEDARARVAAVLGCDPCEVMVEKLVAAARCPLASSLSASLREARARIRELEGEAERLAEVVESGKASTMTVAFDFDGTWTRDAAGMRAVVALLRSRGHTCILLTGRSDDPPWGAEVRAAIGDLMPIVFAGGTWKRDAAKAAGYDVQIFVDDLPEYVAAQDPRRTVGRPKILEDGWVDLPGGARLRYEHGQPVELATASLAHREATGNPVSAKEEALRAAAAHIGYPVELWGAWSPHPVDNRLYARVWKGDLVR